MPKYFYSVCTLCGHRTRMSYDELLQLVRSAKKNKLYPMIGIACQNCKDHFPVCPHLIPSGKN